MLPAEFERMLSQAYQSVGAFDADILYLYTDFRHFGSYAAGYENRNEFCKAIVGQFLARGKTIILTTFTYSVEGRFDVLNSRTKLGVLNKWILEQPGVRRSEHPLFSYAALGPEAGLIEGIGKSAFGYDSVFDRLKGQGTAFLHIGRPISLGNTALHYEDPSLLPFMESFIIVMYSIDGKHSAIELAATNQIPLSHFFYWTDAFAEKGLLTKLPFVLSRKGVGS